MRYNSILRFAEKADQMIELLTNRSAISNPKDQNAMFMLIYELKGFLGDLHFFVSNINIRDEDLAPLIERFSKISSKFDEVANRTQLFVVKDKNEN